MAIYIYNSSTGALFSWCPNDSDPIAPPSELEERGLASISGLPALDQTHVWAPTQKTVITIPLEFTDMHRAAAKANGQLQISRKVAKANKAGDVVEAVQLLLKGNK
jgi:hypothetical protein